MLNNMKVLIGILIVVAGFAYFVTKEGNNNQEEPKSLVPQWQDDLAAIESVDVVELSQQGETLVISKPTGRWIVNGGFYANITPLIALLQSLQAAEIIEAKTANPENHAQLELSDSDLQVRVFSGSETVVALQLGKTANLNQRFVRFVGDEQTYLVEGLKPVVFNQDNWLLNNVLDVPAEQVMRVTFDDGSESQFTTVRSPESSVLELETVPEGMQLKQEVDLSEFASGLSRVVIERALKRSTAEMQLLTTNTYVLKDGSEIVLTVYQQGEDYYLLIDGVAFEQYSQWMMKIAEYKANALHQPVEEIFEVSTLEDQGDSIE